MKGGTSLLLCLIVAVNSYGIAAQKTACENATVGDIVFLVDGSSSIGDDNFQEVRSFLSSAIKALDIGPNKVRIGLVQYSTEPYQEFLLSDHKDEISLLGAVERIPYREGGTETGKAIRFLLEQNFTKEVGSRASQRVPQIVVVITDGDSADDVKEPARLLKEQGVIVFAIGVGQINKEQLKDIANQPSQHFLFTIDSYQALQRLSERLLQTVCVSMEDQRLALEERFSDIFILVDSGIAQGQFSGIRSELVKLINQLDVGASTHRVGLAQYGADIKVEFLLNAFQTKQETLAAVRRFRLRPQLNRPRNLGAALEYGNTHFFTSDAGGRAHQGSKQFLVIVSGKDSDDRVSWPAHKIKSAGIKIVGMSAGATMNFIDLLASDTFAFDSTRLTLLKEYFVTEKLEPITEDCKGANVADIVFIVDESGSIGTNNFQLVRTFLHSIVSGLDVSQTRVRVGIVTYNERPTAHAYLNAFSYPTDIQQFMKILPYNGGGTYTGAALNFTREKIFIEERGRRRGVQQVAVVITDGKSQDNVSDAAAALRRAGVTIYAVGIENANEAELKEMASYPVSTHVFSVDRFSKLKPMTEVLQKTLCTNIIHQPITDRTNKEDTKEACVQKDEADFFFLMDDSGSIENQDFDDMKKFIIEFLHTFLIGPQHVRMGLVKYNTWHSLQFDLTEHSDADELENAVESIRHDGGGTNTGKALLSMGDHFKRAEASRDHKVPEYLVVITDGESQDEVKAPAARLRAQGVIIYAIGVKEANKTELHDIAGDPRRTFFVNNFDALRSIKDKITGDICTPDVCKGKEADIFFLADSSGSIDEKDYLKMKNFMKSVISKSAIGQNEVHIGIMQFSSDYKLEFRLNEYYSKEEMLRAIDDMQQMKRGTMTGLAITEMLRYFDRTGGGRPDLSQRLIVITDGESQDNVSSPAAALRDKGVLIYAIGVGQASTDELVKITGSSDRVFNERNFDALQDLESQVALKICESTKDCNQIERADIIFLVDGSGSIGDTDFESMQKFMESIVDKTTVHMDLTRFGIILYSDEPESIFTLKDCRSKRDVVTAVSGLNRPGQNTYTSKALKFSSQYFHADHGGRKAQKVPQILMVITDGEATDPHDLQKSSDALRDIGVTVFSIGVKEAKRAELVTMAGGDESKVFEVDNFKALETLHKKISSVLCTSTQQACKKEKIDLVFLLDQSSSINEKNGYNYETMLNFTADLVNSFEVNDEAVHIGLAKFSDAPEDEFDLNTYTKKVDVIKRIQKLSYSGGNTYLGDALDHIKHYFKTSRGSRSGVPKNLVLITDGGSHDDVEEPADELRNLGIEVLAVGVGDIHDLELLQITGTPEKLFNVQNFKELAKIKKKLVDTLCLPPEGNECKIDIAVGFDISRRPRAPGEVLISGHTNLQTFLPEIISSVSSVQGVCCSKPVGVNIAFQVLDGAGNPLYDTNFEGYSKDVVSKVMNQQMSEPTYFNTKLLTSFRNMFKAKSTAEVKVLVIFSDGLDEDVWTLENESELLRQSGVSALLTVALEGASNPAQLQMVEFGRGFGYQLPLSIGMQDVGSAIFKQIDTVLERECCNVTCKCSGSPGTRGSPGTPGPKGSPGQKGQPGFLGEEGTPGDRGLPGPSGPRGVQGCPGGRGQKGYRGTSGDRGDLGEDGLSGVDGEQGLTGADGGRGGRGHPGEPGIPGISGEPGQKGERGLRGDPGEPGVDNAIQGPKGDPGNQGFPGKPGPDGRPGGDGVTGNPGQDGRRGSPGEKGAPGAAGARGVPGSPGALGPQGRRGGGGERGPDGISGFPGPQGEPGLAGSKGSTGRRGANGQKGQPGDLGVKGAPGSQGPRGMPGQDGRDGYGPIGTKGAKGDPGFPGFPGLPGEIGSKGGKGYPGKGGNQGRAGNSGRPGDPGPPGDPGHEGHRGPRGPPGKGLNDCQLIAYIRDKCACCKERCPAYPTELVFGLDMSEDVNPAAFERQRSALLNLLDDIAIAETDCPAGARVAVVAYSSETRYLIRFQDYRRKKQLIESVKNIALKRSTTRRELGGAMRFVAHNVFKRVRAGLMMRKVAVFFSNGLSPDISDIFTAMMEYRALNIIPAVISLRNAPAVSRALEVDDTRHAIFTVLGRDLDGDLRRVKYCAICYDPCQPAEECNFIQEVSLPQEVDVDLAMVVDSSREMQADEYSGVQQLLGSVVEQLAVSPQPRRAGNQARVAVVQQSGGRVTKAEFGLQAYQNHEMMRTHLIQTMKQQGGSSALGQTLDFTLNEVLLRASQPRKRRMLLTVVGTQTAYRDRAKLHYISQKAKCEGVALFVVTVGERYNRTQVEELASLPMQQHLIHVGRLKAYEQGYAQRFIRVFLSALNRGINTYPPASVKQICGQLTGQDDGQGSADLDYIAAEPMETEEPVELVEPVEMVKLVEMVEPVQLVETVEPVVTVETVEPVEPVQLVETLEEFLEQTGGKTETSQLYDSDPATTGDDQSSVSGPKLYDACLLSSDVGECRNYTIMWSFNSDRQICAPFWYGGCGGNENRFETERDCEALCLRETR